MSGALWAVLGLLLLNLATYAAFAIDKWRAVRARRRLPESLLLAMSLLGGSLAAKLAQRRLQHKSRKQPFRQRLNAILAVQALCLSTGFVVLMSRAADATPGFH